MREIGAGVLLGEDKKTLTETLHLSVPLHCDMLGLGVAISEEFCFVCFALGM